MQLKKIHLAVTMAVSGSFMVSAALTANAADSSTTTLPEVTISASPVHEHDAFVVPSQIDVVQGTEKAAKQSGSLGATLADIPGVNNQSAGTQAGKPVIRGLTGNRIKVLSNGQSTDYQAYGTRHIPNIDPFLAERIEVIRGPQSVLYGSQAMGGVVNVIQAELPYGKDTHGEVAAEFNSNNRENQLGAKVGAGSEKFAITAGVSSRKADNFRVPTGDSAEGATPAGAKSSEPLFVGEVPFTNFENQAGNIGLGYQDDWGKVEFRYTKWVSQQNFVGIEADSPFSEYEAVPAGQRLNNDEAQLTAEIFAGDWVVKPSWSHTRNQREAAHEEPYEDMFDSHEEEHEDEHGHGLLDILVKRDDFRLGLEHPKVGDFEGEIGIELSEKTQDLRSGHLTPSATESKRAVYLFEEADYDNLLVQFGARYDWHTVKAPVGGENEHFTDHMGVFDESNNSQSFQVGSGSLGATYSLNDQWKLAANVGTGFRAPTIFELYAGGTHGGVQAFQLGNPELEAETSINTDLSLRYQSKNTQMVATVYNNLIDNYIYLANLPGECFDDEGEPAVCGTPGALQGMQAEQTDARISGFEFALNQRFNAKWSADLGLEIIKGIDTENNRDLPLIPANNARVALHFEPSKWQNVDKQKLSLAVKAVASKDSAGSYEPFSQFDEAVKVGTASTAAYSLVDLGYQAQIDIDNQTLNVYAKVDNVFDRRYVDFLNTYKGYTLNTGRNFKLGVNMQF